MYKEFLKFANSSPSSFHSIHNIKLFLEKNGFEEVGEDKLEVGKSYYVLRNQSSIIAFKIPYNFDNKINLVSSHSDSPNYKLKFNPNIDGVLNHSLLNIATYGGMIHSTFFDRPLTVAGRVSYINDDTVKTKLINFNRPVAIIPNLAIHLNRDINSVYTYAMGKDVVPIYSLNESNLLADIEEEFDVDNITAHDLYVSCCQDGYSWGKDDEFISCPRLDNLECAWISTNALINSNPSSISLCAIFDNEEVGSLSYMGAMSDFLQDTLKMIFNDLNITQHQSRKMIKNSVAISADNAHATHPNYVEKYDVNHKCKINAGPVIKFSNNQSYTTDSYSASYFMNICNRSNVPFQVFENHSSIRGGSTLGNLLNAHLSIKSVDIGLAQFAMHSAFETAGTKDINYLNTALMEYYNR